jgi:hypothetical protein
MLFKYVILLSSLFLFFTLLNSTCDFGFDAQLLQTSLN